MGYIQDSIVRVLGGSKFLESRDSIISDWSPNLYKRLFIYRDFIVAEKHVGNVSTVSLDRVKFLEDLTDMVSANNGSYKLNKLLGKRSLSCLEEIYIDPILQSKGVFDIDSYASDLARTPSRLRYYGLIKGNDIPMNEVVNAMSALKNRTGSAFAEQEVVVSRFGLVYKGVDNEDWYFKYYLRPRYYKLDGDNGRLAIYFKKLEDEILKGFDKKKEAEKYNNTSDKVKALILQDDASYPYLEKLDSLLAQLLKNSKDELKQVVSRVVRNAINQDRSCVGIGRMNVLVDCAKNSAYLSRCYENFNVIDTAIGNDVDEKALDKLIERGKGFLDIGGLMDDICLGVSKELAKGKYADMVKIAYVVYGKNVPNGNFKRHLVGHDEGDESIQSIFGYYSILGYIIGYKL